MELNSGKQTKKTLLVVFIVWSIVFAGILSLPLWIFLLTLPLGWMVAGMPEVAAICDKLEAKWRSLDGPKD